MPASARSARPAPARRRTPPARVVTAAPQPRPRQALATIIGLVIGAIVLIVAAIVINTQAAVLSYSTHADQVALARLQQDNDELRSRIDEASSPARLREVAEKEGMVPAGSTGYLTLATHQISGGEEASEPPRKTEDSKADDTAGTQAPETAQAGQ
ncbi:hypothetical protein H8R18_03020 [Nanchangia anserum]|uniref:Cell division protein FtsL n=1 Tax=Nanchangia anserum TaxID=2692125 RepID=A0A8I0KQR0_9ACTO|nr:hypothetical protein [Nanchangia anserum]MBD3690245.1 hypothetical protein [Nanchangia anserum]QOX82313.1 hypothetical protein H8R18_03020 [Nanchangia anserum]